MYQEGHVVHAEKGAIQGHYDLARFDLHAALKKKAMYSKVTVKLDPPDALLSYMKTVSDFR